MSLLREPTPRAAASGEPVAPPGGSVASRVDRLALVAIELSHLRRLGSARVAVAAAGAVALAFGVAVVVARSEGGASASFASILRASARASAWLVGVPLALAASRDREAAERADGIEALAAARGASREALASARGASAIVLGARALGIPVLVVGFVAVAASGTLRAAIGNAAAALAAFAFALVAGVTLGAIGAASVRLAGARSRSLLALVVIAPWLAADLAGRSAYSIPGALGALLSVLMSLAGVGGGAP